MKNIEPAVKGMISWVYTEDLARSSHFYHKILGFNCIRDVGNARIFAALGDASIGVCEVFADRVVEPNGGMITLLSDDVDGWYQCLLKRGLEIAQAPHRIEQFGIYRFSIKDPDGYVIEFQQFDP